MSLRRVEDVLAGIHKRQRREDAELRPTRIEGRNPDGTVRQRRLDGTCIERGPICSAYEGQIIEVPCNPGFRLRGAAGVPMSRIARTVATLWVERLDPEIFLPGTTYDVTVFGNGFTANTLIEFLLLDGETVNPHVTVESIGFVDANTLELVVVVAADAPLTVVVTIDPVTGLEVEKYFPWPIAYDDPGAPN